jgi:hypothetical protein
VVCLALHDLVGPTRDLDTRHLTRDAATLLGYVFVVAVVNQLGAQRRRLAEVAERQRDELASEIQLAAEVQQDILPRSIPRVGGYEFAARMYPARTVAGDYYGFIELPTGEIAVPWNERSAAFMAYATTKHPYSSAWNWMDVGHWKEGKYVVPERGDGPYGPTSHWITATAKISYLYWRRYEYTQDLEWLKNRAYPMLRGAVEFYRCHPNVSKGADGKYHIRGVNDGEPVRGAHHTTEDLAAMRAVTAALIRAAETLQIDSQTLPVWREFFENIAPLPTSDNREAIGVENYHGPRAMVTGLKPVVRPGPPGLLQDINSLPTWFFDLCTVETRDRTTLDIAETTLDQIIQATPDEGVRFGGLSKLALAAASLDRTDAVTEFIPKQMKAPQMQRSNAYKGAASLANRMSLLESAQALGAEHLGRASEALHMALLQSNPPAPAEEPILHCFPAWPKEWDANFTLYARGGFMVTASMQGGSVRLLESYSNAGSTCRLRNPYSRSIDLYRNGKRAESLSGSLLEFKTAKGESIAVCPQEG